MLIMIAGHDHSVAGRIFLGSKTDYLLHHVNIPIYVHKEPWIRENGALYVFIDWTACGAETFLEKGKLGRIRLPKGSSELLPCWWWSQNRDRPFPPHFYPLLKNVSHSKLAQQPSFGSLWEQTEVSSREPAVWSIPTYRGDPIFFINVNIL